MRVLCEGTNAYRAWSTLVWNAITKYGIQNEDIYRFGKTDFLMGHNSSKIVVATSARRERPISIQQGNREWVIFIQGVGSYGYAIPSCIIFTGKTHLSSRYKNNP